MSDQVGNPEDRFSHDAAQFSVCTLFDSELEDDVFVEPERAKVVHYCKPSGIVIPN